MLGQPRVVGEIIGGLILGPSLFGRLFPTQFDFVFKSISPVPMVILSQIGLALLMFLFGTGCSSPSGLNTDGSAARARIRLHTLARQIAQPAGHA